jgi:hypothetical protein
MKIIPIDMSNDYTFSILGNKQVEIWYKGKRKLRFQLKQKRAFLVLTKLIEIYPNYLNLHDLDAIYKDPNKAYSELKLTDGFLNFVSEKKGEKNVIMAKIDLENIFNQFHPTNSDEFIKLTSVDPRGNLSERDKQTIYAKFHGKCNITGVKLLPDRPKYTLFMKLSIIPAYDHRIPLFQGGDNQLDNMQLVSEQVNQEKRKICISCKNVKCEKCALAFPEEYHIIQANFQDISDWRSLPC